MENNGMQPSQPTTPVQPGADVRPPQTPTVNTGWPSAAPPPSAGVGSGASAPGIAPVVTPPAPESAAAPAPAPGMTAAPAGWGAPTTSSPVPAPSPVAPAPAVSPTPMPSSDSGVAPAPAPNDGVVPAPASAGDEQAQEKPTDDQHNPMAIPSDMKAKRKAPIGVIVGAIVVAVLLAAVVVFAYMKTQKNQTSQQVNMPIIGASDVDKTQTQIDESLNGIDDTKDFATSDLSDAALGL